MFVTVCRPLKTIAPYAGPLGFRLACAGSEARHARTESHHGSVECAAAEISSSTLPSLRPKIPLDVEASPGCI